MLGRVRALLARASSLVRRRPDQDFEQELRTHLSLLAERFVRQGMSPEAADAAARRQFGNVLRAKEDRHEAFRLPVFENLWRDLRIALRMLSRSPGFTITAVAALALGAGATTAVFSVWDAIFLKPLRAPQADRMVRFGSISQAGFSDIASLRAFDVWRRQSGVFENVAAHRLEIASLVGGTDPEQVLAARVSAPFFRLFGALVDYGRTFTAEEDRPNAGRFVILSYGLWSRRFAADPKVVGTTLELGDGPYRVIGVLGPGFDTEQFPEPPEIWLPFQIGPDTADGGSICQVTARLRPGVTLGMANAALQLAAAEYRRRFPDSNPKYAVVPLQDALAGPDVRSWLELLAGAVGLVLLIACGNVANLSIARALSRGREIAIRAAVGGRRGRIARQLLTESALVSALGSALGLAIGLAGPRAILALYPANSPLDVGFNPINLPRLGNHGSAIALDWRVAAFAAGLSVLITLLSGLLPAFRVGRADLSLVLRESGGSGVAGAKMRSLLVIGQIAVTVILLVGAALLIRTSAALGAIDPGFDARNVLTIQLPLTGTRFERASERNRLVRDGVQRMRALPGVAAAGVSCCLPLELVWQFPFIIPGRPLSGPFHGFAGWTPVSPGYFDAFRIPLLRGRRFTPTDAAGAPPVVIINEAMARRGWPGNPPPRDPLEDSLILGKSFGPPYDRDPPRQIVGIVADVRDTALNRDPRPIVYVPFAQLPDGIAAATLRLQPLAWIVRTRVEPHALGPAVRDQLRQASGGLPAGRVRTMEEVESRSTARTRFETLLLNIFAGSALLLAVIGIYGLTAYAVRQRTREIGIRLALGAKPAGLRNWILMQGMRLVLAGAAAGLLLAFACSRLLAGFLFGVNPWDPAVFAIIPALLAAVAGVAVWVPARRATRVDPRRVLRRD